MLELINNAIVERGSSAQFAAENHILGSLQNCMTTDGGGYAWPYNTQTVWNSHPVYICTDKTAKAIEILKALQADKILEVKSVPKFIELVEKISCIL